MAILLLPRWEQGRSKGGAEKCLFLVEAAVHELLERLAGLGGVVALGDDLQLRALGGGEEHHLHDGLSVHGLLAAFDGDVGAELAGDGILVNCVCAGVVDTAMWDLIDREVASRKGVPIGSVRDQCVASIPIGRIHKPEDLANAVVWLASEDAGYVVGQAINCCGGLVPY